MDRREHRRAQLRLPVRIRWNTPFGQKTEVCKTLDISRSGLLVPCQDTHAPGVPLWVTFPYDSSMGDSQPEMMAKVTEPALFEYLEHHLDETREQIKRLEQIFQALGQKPQGVTCQAVLGLIEESHELVREIEDKEVLDAAILASAQAIEHYEINRYGTLIAWADQLGHKVTEAKAGPEGWNRLYERTLFADKRLKDQLPSTKGLL